MKDKKDEDMPSEVHVDIDNPSVETAKHYIRMCGMGTLNGCILMGPPGMGKTHLVCHTLKEMGKKFVMYGGHITLAEIYEFLYENNDKLIFFDDVSQVINKTEIMEMLKQALNTGPYRKLHYRSKNVLSPNVKNNFTFYGQIIFAFNLMDRNNPNVRAIMDRAPVLELKYSRKEIIDAMYNIAKAPGGGLLESDKIIVTEEIESYTDSTMDVSLRKQQLSFKIYESFKKMYGASDRLWVEQVHRLFGKKKRTWVEEIFIDLVGETGKIYRQDFVREVSLQRDVSPRTAQRRITDFIDMGVLYQNKVKGGHLQLIPFK